MSSTTNRVASERIAPYMREYIEKNHYSYNSGILTGGQTKLAYATSVSPRLIYGVITGKRAMVDVNSLDLLLQGMDLTYLCWWPPEDGGFSDVFDNMKPIDVASREKYRKYKRKRSEKHVPCQCGKTKHYRSKLCRDCNTAARRAKARKCRDCGTILQGGRRKTESIRCWPCWNKFRKTDKKAKAAYVERRDGHSRVLGKRALRYDA